MDLGLLQREVAELLGIATCSVAKWESGVIFPLARYGPKLVRFIGYDPLDKPRSFGEKIQQLRWRRGLKQRELARKLGVGVERLRKWEQSKYRPTAELLERFERYCQLTQIGEKRVIHEPEALVLRASHVRARGLTCP